VLDSRGTVLLDEPDDGTGGRPEVLRGDLRRILIESLPAEAIQWGKKLAGPDGNWPGITNWTTGDQRPGLTVGHPPFSTEPPAMNSATAERQRSRKSPISGRRTFSPTFPGRGTARTLRCRDRGPDDRHLPAGPVPGRPHPQRPRPTGAADRSAAHRPGALANAPPPTATWVAVLEGHHDASQHLLRAAIFRSSWTTCANRSARPHHRGGPHPMRVAAEACDLAESAQHGG
jgi:hypothetical protein